MNLQSGIKNTGLFLGGLVFIAILFLISAAIFVGVTQVSFWIAHWAPRALIIILEISLIVFGPLALIPPTRGIAAVAFYVASYAFGALLFAMSLAYTYAVWGLFAVFVGIVGLGIGIVPVALLAALFHGDYGNLILFAVTAVLVYGLRALSLWLVMKADERRARRLAEAPSSFDDGPQLLN